MPSIRQFGRFVVMIVSFCWQPAACPAVPLDNRLPVPAPADIEKANQLVDGLYEDPEPQKLIDDAQASGDNDAAKYVLLLKARNLAADKGDVETALRAVDIMDASFRIDVLRLKGSIIVRLGRWADSPSEYKLVVQTAESLIEQAIRQDEYETANILSELALVAAKKTEQVKIRKRVLDIGRRIEESARQYKQAAECLQTLAEQPDEPHCNALVGKYRCFVKGDWSSGLSMLLLGDDATLSDFARKELMGPSTAEAQMELGDFLWDLAERKLAENPLTENELTGRSDGIQYRNLKLRATYWYRRAVPSLTGVSEKRIRARLGESLVIYSNDFDGGMTVEEGIKWNQFVSVNKRVPVQGFERFGFRGKFMWNASSGNRSPPYRLTLRNLPEHRGVSIEFLLAIIDSWDSNQRAGGPDGFGVVVDGKRVFAKAFSNRPGDRGGYRPPADVALVKGQELGFESHRNYRDSAYNMGHEPLLQRIAHTKDSIVIEWQGLDSYSGAAADETWAIDNIKVILHDVVR